MTDIAQKKFEILDYTISDEFTIDGLADKLNELTTLAFEENKNDISLVDNSARYIIFEESLSGHCCFEYTIVDTKKGKDRHGYWERVMCETFEKKEAIDICTALNDNYL